MSYCCPLECAPTCRIIPPNCATTAELIIGEIAPSTSVTLRLEAVDIGREYLINLTSNTLGLLVLNMASYDFFIPNRVFYAYIKGVPITLVNETDSVDCLKIIFSKQLNNSICPASQILQLL
jgi:hypothetical protein